MLPAEEFIVPVPSYDVAKDLCDCVFAWRESKAMFAPLPNKILVKLLRVSFTRKKAQVLSRLRVLNDV